MDKYNNNKSVHILQHLRGRCTRIEVYSDAIIRAEENLEAYEARLRKRFERLEVQLSQLQSQSSALEQALASHDAQTN